MKHATPDGPTLTEMTTVFDHLRSEDREHVGYIGMTEGGGFVPFDRLHRRRGEPSDLDAAERTLDEVGLGFLAQSWRLRLEDGREVAVGIVEVRRDDVVVTRVLEDAEAGVAKVLDLTRRVALPLPTDRLIPA
ncbi:serine/threonine protein phosphatase [Rothia halotolerans]|uniref:serine/threonine protein phosphatase n=1 Tax=Rothia halotolerans TaxID=405770 RepID=UPI001EDD5DBB|nr:serine/threonine protein phosphatase [Rothia halotolerans]